MTISVIIPCYKGVRHIANCLENLLGQKYKMNLEIIVVIDGDIDSSASLKTGIIPLPLSIMLIKWLLFLVPFTRTAILSVQS